jgi:hypothetical protein
MIQTSSPLCQVASLATKPLLVVCNFNAMVVLGEPLICNMLHLRSKKVLVLGILFSTVIHSNYSLVSSFFFLGLTRSIPLELLLVLWLDEDGIAMFPPIASYWQSDLGDAAAANPWLSLE